MWTPTRGRAYAITNPDEAITIVAIAAGIDPKIAAAVIKNRTEFNIDTVPGARQSAVLKLLGPIFVAAGDVSNHGAIDAALSSLNDPRFAKKADPSAFG